MSLAMTQVAVAAPTHRSLTEVQPEPRSPGDPRPAAAICLTLYNEPLKALLATLRSLLTSLSCRQDDPDRALGQVSICILCDGAGQLDPEILSFFHDEGLVQAAPIALEAGIDLHVRRGPVPSVLEQAVGSGRGAPLDQISFYTCIKAENRGKLHSHAVFFGVICPWLAPDYCYQIDAGTLLSPDALGLMNQQLAARSTTAAVAPKVRTACHVDDDFLASWQHFDFALRNEILWPLEVATGHLSVIPGQASALRWAALDGDGRGERPVTAYLRGTEARSPTDRIKYLAEDRVIGDELTSCATYGWRLAYASEALVVTDACAAYGELFRQRRRWINSATACRLSNIGRCAERLTRSEPRRDRLGLAMVALIQFLLILCEYLAPAQVVLYGWALMRILGGQGHGLVAAAHAAVAFSAAGLFLVVLIPKPRRAAIRPLIRDLLLLIGFCGLSVSVGAALSPWASLAALSPVVMGVMIAAPGRWPSWRELVRAQAFIGLNLAFSSVLTAHALWNLPNLSWGTKGLRASRVEADCAKALRRWRGLLFTGWLTANGLVIVIGLAATSRTPVGALGPVILTATMLGWAALATAAGRAIHERWRVTRAARGIRGPG